MSVTLNQVIPWGRSLQEYKRMFNLSAEELDLRILGVGDGPASFNSEMNALGHTVLSIDPIYSFSKAQIEGRIEENYEILISQVKQNSDNFIWDFFSDPAHCGRFRLETMRKFLDDFEVGKVQGRYLPESLPTLNFTDCQFDLVLCSHLLFLYSIQLSFDFHRDSIQELCRVAQEVRIFPLLTLNCEKSPYVAPIQSHFSEAGFTVDICRVPLMSSRKAATR